MALAAPGQLNINESPPLWGSRSVECFERMEKIGEGTYGQVFMAKEKKTGEVVALKKIRMDNEKEGFPITAIREIKILNKLNHDNVVKLKEIVTSPGLETEEKGKPGGNKYNGDIYMVFEYMDHDLTGLANRPGTKFSVPQIKCYMKQLLTGLNYCHVNHVLHRDIKCSNLLVNNEGNLKLADFGLARPFAPDHNGNLTNHVITLWYRPPELLLGATKYGPPADMWSVGCIFAELITGKPIFPGKTEPEQISKIFELCGSPDERNWTGVSSLKLYNNFKPSRPMRRRIREVFRGMDPHAVDLLDKMLALDPSKRISATDALLAEYFWTDPLPSDPISLPKYQASHEFQIKKERQQHRQTGNEEAAKRQKVQQPHSAQPLVQLRKPQVPHWQGGNPTSSAPLTMSNGPSQHHYGQPRGPPGGQNRLNNRHGGSYQQNRRGHAGGYNNNNNAQHRSQGRPPP